jgi:predicted AAA+ superfamily ATPase
MTDMYLPILRGPYSTRQKVDWIVENPTSSLTFDGVVRDIREGQYDMHYINRVVCFNPDTNRCFDATAKIAKAVRTLIEADQGIVWDELVEWLDAKTKD